MKRIAEFMKPGYAHGQSEKQSGYPGWNEWTPKNASEAFVDGDQAAEPSKDLRESYLKGQSCIEKLLLVCFCLRLPARKVSALLAPLLSKRISATNIGHVAINLDRELAGYHRRRRSAKRSQTTAPNREPNNPYPSTMSELEEELDRLLTSLQSVESDLWNRLKTAGLVKGSLQRSAARQKLKGHSSRQTRA
jgi:hypothetical protein